MLRLVKLLGLGICRSLGLFAVARWLSRRRLRILCYHGFSVHDESQFLPKLFMNPAKLEKRLRWLARHDFSVLPLGVAVERLALGRLPPLPTVITFDDGWFSFYARALPMLERYRFPASLYVTSYHVKNETPVFGVVIQYMFWRTECAHIDLTGLGLPERFPLRVVLDHKERASLVDQIIIHGERDCDEAERVRLATAVGSRLGVSYETIVERRALSLMTRAEVADAANRGLDIQLHTHRHRFPEDDAVSRREIKDNRGVLEPIVGKPLRHFCYPSGEWSPRHWPALEAEGVVSATTCEAGLNDKTTPPLALRRFLDGENLAAIEFEASMSGFIDLVRDGLSFLRRGRRAA